MKVYYGHKTRYSGRLLQARLRHVEGRSINFGYQRAGEINPASAVALASNKRLALEVMRDNGVPCPANVAGVPCVARPDKHRAGQAFYLCQTIDDVIYAEEQGATHLMEYIEAGREFRVHVAFGKSIKLAEKIGGNSIIRNFSHGSTFMYPNDFNHKKTLRKIARQAVDCLGLDFGAVDIIWRDKKFYVLEVNTSPGLTSDSDILDRYVQAFKDN
jgi:glutathione synthase/RimK-type ligase-like ATP-grasp enzyme